MSPSAERNCEDLLDAGELFPTFRDPAGQLRFTGSHALRRISPAAVAETRAFLASPLRAALERRGDLVATEIASSGTHPCVPAGELRLQHPRIAPISYPWEWTPAQWVDAAELTLRIAACAIEAGWTLKDATPLNIVFAGPRPVLVDVLSLERRDSHSAIWLAYGQFVRTFLLPLAAAKYLGWPLENTLFHRDGYEPRVIYGALYPWQRLYPHLFDVVTLATLFEGSGGKERKGRGTEHVGDAGLATHLLLRRIARLGKQIRRAAPSSSRSRWSDYPQSSPHYSASDIEGKKQFVRRALDRLRPSQVLDVGANTGTYSLLAAEAGARVVALDSDAAAIESLWNSARQNNKPVTALVANIARPTPAAGWRNREHLSLLDRLTGNFDLVLMLAVIHHLILREQVPLGHIAWLCSTLARRELVLEWVPPSDPMYREWLRGRDSLYGMLSEDDLLRAFKPFFHVTDRTALGNGRVLFLFERDSGPGQSAGAALE
ncbi:MAG: class I SAM-dependent methyltransferase [Terracidiphilus sp.]